MYSRIGSEKLTSAAKFTRQYKIQLPYKVLSVCISRHLQGNLFSPAYKSAFLLISLSYEYRLYILCTMSDNTTLIHFREISVIVILNECLKIFPFFYYESIHCKMHTNIICT